MIAMIFFLTSSSILHTSPFLPEHPPKTSLCSQSSYVICHTPLPESSSSPQPLQPNPKPGLSLSPYPPTSWQLATAKSAKQLPVVTDTCEKGFGQSGGLRNQVWLARASLSLLSINPYVCEPTRGKLLPLRLIFLPRSSTSGVVWRWLEWVVRKTPWNVITGRYASLQILANPV